MTRVVRHNHGAIVSGGSYCFKSRDSAVKEALKHEALNDVLRLELPDGSERWLAQSGKGNAVRFFGTSGHEVFVTRP